MNLKLRILAIRSNDRLYIRLLSLRKYPSYYLSKTSFRNIAYKSLRYRNKLAR